MALRQAGRHRQAGLETAACTATTERPKAAQARMVSMLTHRVHHARGHGRLERDEA